MKQKHLLMIWLFFFNDQRSLRLFLFLGTFSYALYAQTTQLCIVGFETPSSAKQATLWFINHEGEIQNKFPLSTSLHDSYSFAITSIGSTIFCGGFQNNGSLDRATLWVTDVNGTKPTQYFIGNESEASDIESLISFGNRLYCFGMQRINTKTIATIWIIEPSSMRVLNSFNIGPLGKSSWILDAVQQGNKIYCVGFQQEAADVNATLWILEPSGVLYSIVNLETSPNSSSIRSVLYNNTLYCGGGFDQNLYTLPTLWTLNKNNQLVKTAFFESTPNEGLIYSLSNKNDVLFSVGIKLINSLVNAIIWISEAGGENAKERLIGLSNLPSVAFACEFFSNQLYSVGQQYINNHHFRAALWITD